VSQVLLAMLLMALPGLAALPTPILDYGSAALASSQQRTLSITLPSPSPFTASGLVNLTFQPDTTLIADDPSIIFLATGTRVLPFSVTLGGTSVLINGHPNTSFQTGTTSGRILFTLTGIAQGITGNPTTMLIIPPSAVSLDVATATRLAGEVDVSLIGSDNTLTTGGMAFTFRDSSGQPIGAGIRADFTTAFAAYFTKTKAGSAFQALLAFGVHGDTGQIASVDVDLANAAGTITEHLVLH
jgi:hypothetical protein